MSDPDDASDEARNPKPTPKDVAELGQAVNTAVSTLRSLTFSYLLVIIYVAIATGGVSDRNLLVGTDVQLPLLDTSVGLTEFFWLAPLLFVVLHGNLLMHLYLVVERTFLFEVAVADLPAGSVHVQDISQIAPFPFIEWQTDTQPGPIRATMFRLLSWLIYIILPLVLLLFLQWRALPYQDARITFIQTVAILASAALIALFWWPGGASPRPWHLKDMIGRWPICCRLR